MTEIESAMAGTGMATFGRSLNQSLNHNPNLQRLHLIENKLRAHSFTKRIRVEEFFKDFDRLRTGYITKDQFRRAINRNFTNSLNADEFDLLANKYESSSRPNCINYKDFVATIDSVFNQMIIEKDPLRPLPTNDDLVGSMRTQHLSHVELEHFNEVMNRVFKYVDYHGINIKNCYNDFDKHNNGLVTENQFYRNFPVLSHFSKEDIGVLNKKYTDQKSQGVCYLRFHRDLVSMKKQQEDNANGKNEPREAFSGDTLDLTPGHTIDHNSVDDIEERLRVEIFKNRIRIIEFFKDYDKHCDGLITENQFRCGLSLCRFLLSRKDIGRLVRKYSTTDNRIKYKDFCSSLNTIFTINNLEKTPQKEVFPPSRERLVKETNQVSPEEEERHRAILEDLCRRVNTRRVQMLPFFKDFDKGQGNTGRITRSHFCRLLAILSLEVPSEDMNILIRKYEDPDTGDINYPAFIREVDLDSSTRPANLNASSNTIKPSNKTSINEESTPAKVVDGNQIFAQIQSGVLKKRVRVTEFFRDFDKLRTGCISRSQFRQGLSAMGHQGLSEAEFECLANMYTHPSKPDMISHSQFSKEIDNPDLQDEAWENTSYASTHRTVLSPKQEALVANCLAHFRRRIENRRILVKPSFYDFDNHNNGHVSQNQFLQCLTYLGLDAPQEEKEACMVKFCDASKRFNYLAFLEELGLLNKQKQTVNQRRKYNIFVEPEENVEIDHEALMYRLQRYVMKDRIRVIEFMNDYDKLRTGRIPKTSFRRALNMCAFSLTEQEIAHLEKHFESAEDARMVYYVKFSDMMEEAFTIKGLEKMPTLNVNPFIPSISTEKALLSPRSERVHDLIMHKIAEKVRTHRMIILPHFEDYDRVHNGSVSKSQFRSVLSHFNLQLDDMESNILNKKYDVQVGGKDDVDYIKFTNKIAEYSLKPWRQDEGEVIA